MRKIVTNKKIFKENLKEAKQGKDIISEKNFSLEEKLEIAGKTSYIIEVL